MACMLLYINRFTRQITKYERFFLSFFPQFSFVFLTFAIGKFWFFFLSPFIFFFFFFELTYLTGVFFWFIYWVFLVNFYFDFIFKSCFLFLNIKNVKTNVSSFFCRF